MLIDSGDIVILALIGSVALVIIIWIIAATIESVAKGRAREQTTRDMTAFIAEGSISVEDGKALLAIAQQGDIAKQFADWHFSGERAVDVLRALKETGSSSTSKPSDAAPQPRTA